MCTLTVIPTAAGYRLAFNRDERPTRPAAVPPAWTAVGGRGVIHPTDPESGGTWLAVNDSGLSLAVLNGNPGGPKLAGRVSRGTLIPTLADAATVWQALTRAVVNPLADFAPFRLVAVGGGVVGDLWWAGTAARLGSRVFVTRPAFFTSSGLGDAVVTPPRAALFDELFAAPPHDWPAAQDTFHRHRWPGREHVSVNMERPTARTVSAAVIEVGGGRARVRYHAAAPHEPGADTELDLPLILGGTP